MIKILSYLKVSKTIWKALASLIIGLFIIAGFYQAWNYTTYHNKQYKNLVVQKDSLTNQNLRLIAWIDSVEKELEFITATKKTNDSLFQGLIKEIRFENIAKGKAIEKYKKGIICKVPQKVKVGFMKNKTILVEVDCDSLQKALR